MGAGWLDHLVVSRIKTLQDAQQVRRCVRSAVSHAAQRFSLRSTCGQRSSFDALVSSKRTSWLACRPCAQTPVSVLALPRPASPSRRPLSTARRRSGRGAGRTRNHRPTPPLSLHPSAIVPLPGCLPPAGTCPALPVTVSEMGRARAEPQVCRQQATLPEVPPFADRGRLLVLHDLGAPSSACEPPRRSR